MCGRYTISSSPAAIRALFGYAEQPNFPARYNVAPTQPVPIVRMWEGKRQFALVRWGLIPFWVDDPRGFTLLINARADAVLDKPSFRNAMRRRRCLFPADGFYEWQETPRGKRPYAVVPRAGGPIAFAGLWECWVGPNGEELETAAIITTNANATLRPVHDRVPVVIAPEDFETWLDCAKVDAQAAATLLAPPPEDFFRVYEISTAVNRIENDTAELLTPAASTAFEETGPQEAGARKPARFRRSDSPGQGSLF